MDFKELLFAIQKSVSSLSDGWLFKSIISATLAGIGSVHVNTLGAFIVLIFIDLFTRWAAISKQHLIDSGKTEESKSICCCITDIIAAFKAGYINSSAMKNRFAGKLLVYGLLTIMAANVDTMLLSAGESQILLRMTWVYLAATEAMSILENLREAGVEQAARLLDFVKARLGVLFDRNKNK